MQEWELNLSIAEHNGPIFLPAAYKWQVTPTFIAE